MSSVAARKQLIAAILDFLAPHDLAAVDEVRIELEREVDAAGPVALMTLKDRLTVDRGWDYCPPDHLARRIHHLLARRFVHSDSHARGLERFTHIGTAPVALFANHLSYADANVIEVLLRRSGAGAMADRLTAVAGPKVFSSPQRRFSSLCFGTIKVPQSAEVSSEQAMLGIRDIARAAKQAIDVAHARLRTGDLLLLFAEGTRSRTGAMQPLLVGATRYLSVPGLWIVPAGLTGSEVLFPVDRATVQPATVVMQVGAPVRADALLAGARGDRRILMDALGLAIAELLPERYRGVYGCEDDFVAARRALDRARAC